MLGSILRGAVKARLPRQSTSLRQPFLLKTFCDNNQQNNLGTRNFERIRAENSFYVDKTQFAEELLNFEQMVLLRPPRTGKSLLLDTCDCLYDMSFEPKFGKLFGDLHVGKTRAKGKANTFYMLPIVLPAGPLPDDYTASQSMYHESVMAGVLTLLERHPKVQKKMKVPLQFFNNNNYASCISHIRDIVGREKLWLLVDEYDRAPMEEYILQMNETGVGSMRPGVKGPLQHFLHTLKNLGCRYLVCGIHPLPGPHI